MSSASDWEAIERELASDVEPQELEGLKGAWELAGDPYQIPADVRAASWAAIQGRIDALPDVAPVRRASRSRREIAPVRPLRLLWTARPQFAIAASLVLLALAGYLTRPTDSVYQTPVGGSPQEITLRDGTRVQLASGSTLRHEEGFNSGLRAVSLDGEGFFDVTPASSQGGRAFHVATFNADITVVGTAFNVRARRGDVEADTRVSVEHGMVQVASKAVPEMSVALELGQETVVGGTSTPLTPRTAPLERVLAWMSGGIAFDDAPMGEVFDEIERRYAVSIDAPEAIRRTHVSYWRESSVGVEAMLADLADLVDAGIRRNANGFSVFQIDR